MSHGAQRASAVPVAPDAGAVRSTRATFRTLAARIAVGGGLGLLLMVQAAGIARAHGTTGDAGPRLLPPEVRSGQPVVDDGLTVVAPPRGQKSWGEMHFQDGSAQALQVETRPDGRVVSRHLIAAGTPPPSSGAERSREMDLRDLGLAATAGDAESATTATTNSECSSTSNYAYPWRMPAYRWYYQAGSTPSSLSSLSTRYSIARANANIVSARNSCGRADYVSATFSYLGSTSRGTNVGSRGSCPGGDGVSVIGFGYLPSGVLAMACVYGVRDGVAREGDVRLRLGVRWSNSRTSCSSATLVEAAMTHELGHIYGLGHVSTTGQTMHPYIANCSLAATTLGRGDLYGLERKY